MPGDIRRTVSVDADDLVKPVGVFQSPPTILSNGVKVRFIHIEKSRPTAMIAGSISKPSMGIGPKTAVGLAGGRSGCQADNGHAFHLEDHKAGG